MLGLDPLTESAHRQMMRLLACSGQQGAVLAQYETCRQLLQDELGVEPTGETTALNAQIQGGELEVPLPAPAPVAPPRYLRPPPWLPPVSRFPLTRHGRYKQSRAPAGAVERIS